MTLSSIKILGTPVRATPAEVAKAEEQLWLKFPDEYREYVTTLGEGVLGGAFVRVYPPWRVLGELDEWRARIKQHWFWDKGRKLLPKERAIESVIVGDTVNGDELVFHPGRPNRLFVLPRDREMIFEAGNDLLAAVEWMCGSGKLTRKFDDRNFEPFDSRKQKKADGAKTEAAETLDATVAALQKWANGRKLLKATEKAFAEWLSKTDEPLFGIKRKIAKKEKIKTAFKNQELVFQPEKYTQPQVITTLSVIDTESGAHLGEYQSFADLNGEMSGSGISLTYNHAAILAENWLGLKVK